MELERTRGYTHTHTYPIERSSNLAIVILVESPSVPSTWSHVQFHQLPNFLIFQREHWIRRNAFFIYGRKSDNGTKIIQFFFGNLRIELWIHFFLFWGVCNSQLAGELLKILCQFYDFNIAQVILETKKNS